MTQSLLTIPVQKEFLPVATTFSEMTMRAFQFGAGEINAIKLATEELFVYLCSLRTTSASISIRLDNYFYKAVLSLKFEADQIDFQAFNSAAEGVDDRDDSLATLGLFVASRAVDSLRIDLLGEKMIELVLQKERTYKETAAEYQIGSIDHSRYRTFRATPEESAYLFAQAAASGVLHGIPAAILPAEKTADICRAGHLQGILISGANDVLCGGIFYRWYGTHVIEFIGPIILDPESGEKAERLLLEEAISSAAKTKATGILYKGKESHIIRMYFDRLAEGYYFRQMLEDPGSAVYTDAVSEKYLRAEYKRLSLPRDIRIIGSPRSGKEMHSVMTADIEKSMKKVTLMGALPGNDIIKNLIAQSRYFELQGFEQILFVADTGVQYHTAFTVLLGEAGFFPLAVLPYAGKGDVVIYQKNHL